MTPGITEDAVTVINGNWGLTSLSAIRAILLSAHRVLVRSFEAAPECGCSCIPLEQGLSVYRVRKAPIPDFSQCDRYLLEPVCVPVFT